MKSINEKYLKKFYESSALDFDDFSYNYKKYSPMSFIVSEFKRRKILKIIDIGCGTGKDLVFLHKNKFYKLAGNDFSKSMIQCAKEKFKNRKNVQIKFYNEKWEDLSNINEKYDALILKGNSISHVLPSHFKKVFMNFLSIVKEKGYLYIDARNKTFYKEKPKYEITNFKLLNKQKVLLSCFIFEYKDDIVIFHIHMVIFNLKNSNIYEHKYYKGFTYKYEHFENYIKYFEKKNIIKVVKLNDKERDFIDGYLIQKI